MQKAATCDGDNKKASAFVAIPNKSSFDDEEEEWHDALCRAVEGMTVHSHDSSGVNAVATTQEEIDFLLATSLQEEMEKEEKRHRRERQEQEAIDFAIASTTETETDTDKTTSHHEDRDSSTQAEVAAAVDEAAADELAYQVQLHILEEEADEHKCMRASPEGRAWLLVRDVLDFERKESYFGDQFFMRTVAMDDMVFWAKNFIQCQDRLKSSGRPHLVTLAYHYTDENRMKSIREQGLMTPADRRDSAMAGQRHGGAYGAGIYVGCNPFAFQSFGPVGLLVAVMYGATCRVGGMEQGVTMGKTHDTVVGNKQRFGPARLGRLPVAAAAAARRKWPNMEENEEDRKGHFSDEFVLQTSHQCLPLFRFPATLPRKARGDDGCAGNEALWNLHQGIQNILDKHLHEGVPTQLFRILPSHAVVESAYRWGGVTENQTRYPKAPVSTTTTTPMDTEKATATSKHFPSRGSLSPPPQRRSYFRWSGQGPATGDASMGSSSSAAGELKASRLSAMVHDEGGASKTATTTDSRDPTTTTTATTTATREDARTKDMDSLIALSLQFEEQEINCSTQDRMDWMEIDALLFKGETTLP